jgi:tetratricopeptide (TPR) repeat protein
MYEFIAGNPPLQGATAAETMYRHLNEPAAKLGFANQTIATEKLASLIASGLERDAKLRPQSAAIVTENLKQIYALLGDKTELALGQARSPKRLKRTVVLALALGIPFIAIAAFYFNRVVPPQSNGTTCNGRTLATTLQNGSSKSSSDTTLMQGNKALRIEVANQEKRIRRMSLAGQISELEQDSDLLGVHGVPSGDIRRLAAIIVAHEVIADCRKRNKRNELFAALNLLNNLQLNVNENIETRITTLRSALALFPDHTVEANFCLASLADLYLQIKNLDAAEACAKRIDIHSKPQIISNALWRPSGSSPEVRQNVLLGHIACLRNDYAGSLPYFARAEQLERDEEEFSQLAMLIHDKTAHFWRMGKKKEAREILTRFEKEVSAIAPENYDKVHLDIVFAIMKDTAKALHDDALLQKTEDDSKTMAIRAKRPTTDEQVFNKALQGWR